MANYCHRDDQKEEKFVVIFERSQHEIEMFRNKQIPYKKHNNILTRPRLPSAKGKTRKQKRENFPSL